MITSVLYNLLITADHKTKSCVFYKYKLNFKIYKLSDYNNVIIRK